MDVLRLSERFEENSVDCAISVHALEHFEYPSGVQMFLHQTRRVLKPGGTLRLVVPDLALVAAKYVKGEDLRDIYNFDAFIHKDLPAERFLYFMRGWEHTIVFDEHLLTALLIDAGFIGIQRRAFGVSDIPDLRGLDRFQTESMSIECRKP